VSQSWKRHQKFKIPSKEIAPRIGVFLDKVIVLGSPVVFPQYVDDESLLPCAQQTANFTYLEPD